MKITKRQLRRIIREEKARLVGRSSRRRRVVRRLREEHQGYDAREDESLAALHGPASEHEQDYKDRRDDAGFEERLQNLERHHAESQGYDAREDEHLGAEHGAAAEHDQDYKDRRDDAGFEVRHENRRRRRRSPRITRRQLERIIRQETRKR